MAVLAASAGPQGVGSLLGLPRDLLGREHAHLLAIATAAAPSPAPRWPYRRNPARPGRRVGRKIRLHSCHTPSAASAPS